MKKFYFCVTFSLQLCLFAFARIHFTDLQQQCRTLREYPQRLMKTDNQKRSFITEMSKIEKKNQEDEEITSNAITRKQWKRA